MGEAAAFGTDLLRLARRLGLRVRGAEYKVPVRWKQFLVTWSVIYLLVLGVPLVVLPVLRWLFAGK